MEVVVAAVLLAIGVGGSLNALLVASQLRSLASVRDVVAEVLASRLGWFAASACGVTGDAGDAGDPGDPSDRLVAGVPVSESWRVWRDSEGVHLEARVLGGHGPHLVRRSLAVNRVCP